MACTRYKSLFVSYLHSISNSQVYKHSSLTRSQTKFSQIQTCNSPQSSLLSPPSLSQHCPLPYPSPYLLSTTRCTTTPVAASPQPHARLSHTPLSAKSQPTPGSAGPSPSINSTRLHVAPAGASNTCALVLVRSAPISLWSIRPLPVSLPRWRPWLDYWVSPGLRSQPMFKSLQSKLPLLSALKQDVNTR